MFKKNKKSNSFNAKIVPTYAFANKTMQNKAFSTNAFDPELSDFDLPNVPLSSRDDIHSVYSLGQVRPKRKTLYEELTNPHTFRGQLISIHRSRAESGFGFGKAKGLPKGLAAVKIQSFWRMIYTNKKIKDYETMIDVSIIQIKTECMRRYGGWSEKLHISRYLRYLLLSNIGNQLYNLIHQLSKEENKENAINTIRFLFACLYEENSETTNAYNINVLLTDILCLDLKNIDLTVTTGIFLRPPFNDHVDFNQFITWFKKYNSKEKLHISKSRLVYFFIF